MTNLNINLVEVVNNQSVTTSLKIAEVFNKEHKNVLKSIEILECSEEFRSANFSADVYFDVYDREQKQYNITRDGFTFLAMGFTGKKAAQFKEAYIKAFNTMEQMLLKASLKPTLPSNACPYNKYLTTPDIPQELKNLEIVKLDPNYKNGERLCYWCPTVCECPECYKSVYAQVREKVGLYIHTIFEKMIKSEIDKDCNQYNLLDKVIYDLIKTNREEDWKNGFNMDFIQKINELALIGYKTKYNITAENAKQRICLA
ncbi:MAG: Rha family transcriptional regulator [Endomicrobium sp.]|jgi:Rha family phage regulatory protein|nr:Rha family transcriptional regulator [Endomicrobium sp.]